MYSFLHSRCLELLTSWIEEERLYSGHLLRIAPFSLRKKMHYCMFLLSTSREKEQPIKSHPKFIYFLFVYFCLIIRRGVARAASFRIILAPSIGD